MRAFVTFKIIFPSPECAYTPTVSFLTGTVQLSIIFQHAPLLPLRSSFVVKKIQIRRMWQKKKARRGEVKDNIFHLLSNVMTFESFMYFLCAQVLAPHVLFQIIKERHLLNLFQSLNTDKFVGVCMKLFFSVMQKTL